jgi:hypothetical protein
MQLLMPLHNGLNNLVLQPTEMDTCLYPTRTNHMTTRWQLSSQL